MTENTHGYDDAFLLTNLMSNKQGCVKTNGVRCQLKKIVRSPDG